MDKFLYAKVTRFNKLIAYSLPTIFICLSVAPRLLLAQPLTQSADPVVSGIARATELSKSGEILQATELLQSLRTRNQAADSMRGIKYAMIDAQLAIIFLGQNRLGEAEPLFKSAVATLRAARNSPGIPVTQIESFEVSIFDGLARIYREQARNDELDKTLNEQIELREKLLPKDHPDIAASLTDLGYLYLSQGRVEMAEPLLERARAIMETNSSSNEANIKILSGLGLGNELLHRDERAKNYFERAIAESEKAYGKNDVRIAGHLTALGNFYQGRDRLDEAEALYKRASELQSSAKDGAAATTLNMLALLNEKRGRYSDAEALLNRSLKILETSLGDDHPNVAATLNGLSQTYLRESNWRSALDAARRAIKIFVARSDRGESQQAVGASVVEAFHTAVAARLFLTASSHLDMNDAKLRDESFEISQWAYRTQASRALTQMAARQAAGSGLLADMVRSLQDAQFQWQATDKLLSKALAEGNRAAADNAREQMKALDTHVKESNERLARDFPKYAELVLGKPVSITETQNTLKPDEALVTFTFGDDEAFLFVVRKDVAKFLSLPVKRADTSKLVGDLRDALDPKGRSFDKMPSFDAAKAHELYQKLFSPVDEVIRGAAQLIVVADGPLQSLPLSLLVTEPPKEPTASPKDYRRYRDVSWLIRRQAVTIIPAVSSLVSLRTISEAQQPSDPFVGFGDPDFDGKGSANAIRGVQLASLFRGAAANVGELRKLPRLPETAKELRAEAKLLGATKSSIYLGKNATVTKVKSLDLSTTRVVAFATHGFVAGELPKLAEPALALTPPIAPTQDDDGLLRASEVSQLKLNADWVLLSACNTAASDGRLGAEGLSGLAKAFFYAGARSLLVSHWSVDSAATVQLVTSAFNALKDDPAIGRAEAFRRAMLDMIDNADKSDETTNQAHPAFWAPFEVVGDGGR